MHAHGYSARPAAALLAAALFFGLSSSTQAACDAGSLFPNKQRQPIANITVKFNPTLDAALETGLGNTNSRWACFQAAVAAWNAVLAQINPNGPQLTAQMDNDVWAADKNAVRCTDENNANVYDQSYANHHGDGVNAASTGHDHAGQPPKHGWIRGDELQTYVVDGRLAECKLTPDGSGAPADPPATITEADILWFTHLKEGNDCATIPWDYRGAAMIAGYDFYSVMLHEVGHLLGLMHQDGNGNVMKPSLNPNTRCTITQGEIDCLMELYAPPPVPAQETSWGQVKRLYRCGLAE